jgi:membrane protein implicated in regulation of membrane protease activity
MRRILTVVTFCLAMVCALGALAALVVTPIDALVGPGRAFKFVPEMARTMGEPVVRGTLFCLFALASVLFLKNWRASRKKVVRAS